eukprot:Rhum_TRINITY_DN14095_c23_g1::Rhum_TRINITY_DN14095_c23_g1_i1::g.68978::m.68978/K21760/RIOX2, MINA; bifunctional lysine-specific demethylase and histidyl-hydroxylase MINA
MSAQDKVNALRKRLGKGGPPKRKASDPGAAGSGLAKKAKVAAKLAQKAEGLDWLVKSPGMSRDKFTSEHWEKKPLHVSRNDDTYYNTLVPGLGSVEKLWERMEKGEVDVTRLNLFRCRDGSTKETPDVPPQTWQEMKAMFEAGWSMQWLQPQHEDDMLARITTVLESHFGSLVGVNAYLTTAGTQGLAPHYDDVEVFVLQLSGAKQWSLHTHTKQTHLAPEQQTLPRFTSTDLELQLLAPACMKPLVKKGDLLYFPRGTIHFATSVGTEPSIHLTISTYQKVSHFEVVQKAFEEVAAMLWTEEPGLRAGVPLRSFSLGSDLTSVTKQVTESYRNAVSAFEQNASEMTDLAVSQLASDFVSCRHPPFLKPQPELPFDDLVLAHRVVLPDPTVLTAAELPPDDESEEPVFSLLHCVNNKRENHMLGKVEKPVEGDDEEEEEEEEEDEEEDEEDEE